MRSIPFLTAVSIAIASISFAISAATAAPVTFHAASPPLNKFMIKRMMAKGIENPQPEPGVALAGELFLPEGDGPFPAVVLSHDCRGIRRFQTDFAEQLTDSGYAALLIDTYGPRDVEAGTVCANLSTWDTKDFVGGRSLDIYGALDFLTSHEKIDAGRLGLIGWDRDSTLSAVATLGNQKTFPHLKPKLAVSISPDCRRFSSGDFAAPVLIIAATQDDWWPAENCKKLQEASRNANGAVVDLVMVEAAHGFDDPDLGNGMTIDAFNPNAEAPKATFAHSPSAAAKAAAAIHTFLDEKLR